MMDKLAQRVARRRSPADPQIARLRPRAGPRRLRRQLRALSRRRRRRRQGLSQPQRRRLAVGRHARRHRAAPSATASARPTTRPARAAMPAFGRDGMLKRAEISSGRRLRPLAVRPAGRGKGADLGARQEGLRRQLRRLSRRRRQGQPRARRAQPDRRDLALWLRRGDASSKGIMQRPRRRDAGLGRPPRRRHDQGAGGLRPHARRRREVIHAPDRPELGHRPDRGRKSAGMSAASSEHAAEDRATPRCSRVAERRARACQDESTTTARSTRRAGRSIRRACTAPSAASNGRCSSSRSASTTCCRSCAGIAGRMRPIQAVLIDFPNRRFYFFFIEIWPQEVYYLTGLLILAAMTLFLMNARRRPGLVRLSLPADGVDRSVLRHRALRRRRPPRAHAARRRAVDRASASRARPPSISSG